MCSKDPFEELVSIMLEGTGRVEHIFNVRYETYKDKRLNGVLFTSFENFCYQQPILMWGAQNIQQQFRKHCLGEAYWVKKMEQFRLVRKEMKVVQT